MISSPKFTTFKKLWPYLWPDNMPDAKLRLILALSALVLSKVSVLYVPIIFKYAIDFLNNPTNIKVPIGLMILYGFMRLVSSAFSEIRDATFAKVAQRSLRQVGLKIFDHLHHLSLRFHLERQTGGLTRAIERGTKSIETLLTFLSFNILPIVAEIILVSIFLWIMYDAYFAIITLLTMVTYIVFTLKLSEWRTSYVRKMNENDSESQTKAIDSLLNYETVKYFNNEDHEKERFDQSLRLYEKAAVQSKISLSYLNIGQVLIISVGLIAVMTLASQQVIQKTMTVGDLVAVNTFLIQLYIPLFNLGFAYREIKLALVNLESMFSVMEEPEEIKDLASAQPIKIIKGEIRFENVSFSYQENRSILKEISFTIPSGRTLAIVGASGAGKSTISRLLFRFYDVSRGVVLIDGQDIRSVTQQSLRRAIGIVPQDTVLFNDTIGYNILYGRIDATKAEMIDAAKQARIHDFIESLPEGYNTRVGERGLKLSGGEKQRVAIARTLLKRPKIFLFDEATSALDTRTEKEIQQNLREISKNKTTLIIAHRLSTIIDADQIIVLEKGKIVERGDHQTLLKENGVYTAMWKRQQEKKEIQITNLAKK
ncbi:MAG: ABC transporter ATP-binding protein/permease [Alphaproteobacteria bacterium]|nr:ABC transporter ATP-binding protein/permease [Alphaproteobacteria bacterium]